MGERSDPHQTDEVGTLEPRPDRHTLWHWAAGIMNGDGASTRSGARAAPLLHILTERDEMWCSGGRAMAFVSIQPRYCSACLALCGEMWDELAEPLPSGSTERSREATDG